MSDQSQPFSDMAARIEKIDLAEFAGAVVIVPPGEGEPITFLHTDPNPVLAAFWAAVSGRVEIGVAKAQEAETSMQPWGSGRR
jgi:hypothetical protein